MIKKLLIFFFLLPAFFLLTSKPLFAQELSLAPENSQESTPSPAIIKYNLAYPGILPDHPLYKLKVLRDRISASLTSDPKKKIDFYLLQADKGILATAILVDKNKIELAEQTALKAEHNMTLASNTLKAYYPRQNPEAYKALLARLETASLKHQEVLNSLLERVPEDQKNTFKAVIDFSKRNLETIKKTISDYESPKETL